MRNNLQKMVVLARYANANVLGTKLKNIYRHNAVAKPSSKQAQRKHLLLPAHQHYHYLRNQAPLHLWLGLLCESLTSDWVFWCRWQLHPPSATALCCLQVLLVRPYLQNLSGIHTATSTSLQWKKGRGAGAEKTIKLTNQNREWGCDFTLFYALLLTIKCNW